MDPSNLASPASGNDSPVMRVLDDIGKNGLTLREPPKLTRG
jgi:hypothetical protein